MATHDMTGSRIRERRLDQGLRQADVAEAAGISASYLNLIEHNKRRIGGKLLSHLAQALDISAAALSQGADAGVLDGMQAAAARGGHKVETDRAEDLATRFPGWAGLIAAQDSRIDTLEGEMRMLRDRMTHDPALADALHNVITAVTAIQATAGILTSDDTIIQSTRIGRAAFTTISLGTASAWRLNRKVWWPISKRRKRIKHRPILSWGLKRLRRF